MKKLVCKTGTLTKREFYLTDTSGYIKVILWEEYTDKVQVSKTHMMSDLRVKQMGQERYLSTPKKEPCEIYK